MSTPASANLLGLHQPGTTWLHRLPAGAKLLGLLLAGIVVVTLHGPRTVVAELVVTLAVVASSRMGLRSLVRSLRGLLLVVAMLAAYLLWQQGWERAVESVGDLVTLVLLATVLTVTTPIDEVLDTITRSLRPARRLGIDPQGVALAFSLLLRGIPTTLQLADETRDAALARGLERDPRARLTPLVIRVVAHARATGDALHARGIHD
jgi:biotin transport system permease protein